MTNHDLHPRARSDRGAALVEMAIMTPLLFLLIFGVIEFGWGFAQYLDVRHGTREGARLAAVNFADPDNAIPSQGATQSGEIIEEACSRMGGDAVGASVMLTFANAVETDTGDRAFIEITSDLDTLTGFLDFALGSVEIDDKVSFRLERDVTWAETVAPVAC